MHVQTPVSDIVETINDTVTDSGTPVHADALLHAFGRAALVPALIVPALLVVSPLSGIPLFSSLCGIAMVVIALQGAWGCERPWLPKILRNRTLPAEGTHKATRVMHKIARTLDAFTRQRLQILVVGPFKRLLFVICALAAACIPFLELVPMTSTLIGAGVLLVGIGILARDGIFAIVGLMVLCGALMLPWFLFAQMTALMR